MCFKDGVCIKFRREKTLVEDESMNMGLIQVRPVLCDSTSHIEEVGLSGGNAYMLIRETIVQFRKYLTFSVWQNDLSI